MELRGHENVVEVITFAPIAAYAAIRQLTGIPVEHFLVLEPCVLPILS